MNNVRTYVLLGILIIFVLSGLKYADTYYIKGLNDGQLLILDRWHKVDTLLISYDSSCVIYYKEMDSLINKNTFFGTAFVNFKSSNKRGYK